MDAGDLKTLSKYSPNCLEHVLDMIKIAARLGDSHTAFDKDVLTKEIKEALEKLNYIVDWNTGALYYEISGW